MKRLIVFECTPLKDMANEGFSLENTLNMNGKVVDYMMPESSVELQDLLELNLHKKYPFIHLSGHGRARGVDEPKFCQPRGFLRPMEFPEDCFDNRLVTFSACEMGLKKFWEPFMIWTGAREVIAPRFSPKFVDSALWYINFYYLMLHKRIDAQTACKAVNKQLKKRVGGEFEYIS